MGTSLGAMLAPPLIAWCIMFHSWQFAFIVSGSLALLAALFWFFCYKDPKDAKRLSDEERHYIESGQEQHLKTDKKEKRQSSISSANVISGGLASRVFSLTRHGEPLTSGYRFSSSKRCILA